MGREMRGHLRGRLESRRKPRARASRIWETAMEMRMPAAEAKASAVATGTKMRGERMVAVRVSLWQAGAVYDELVP